MTGPDGSEMAAIQGDDEIGIEPLGKGHDGGVGTAQGELLVSLDKLGDSRPVFGLRGQDFEVRQAGEKSSFDTRSEPFSQ